MSSASKILMAAAALLVSNLACVTMLGTPPPAAESPAAVITVAPVTAPPATEAPALLSCPIITDKIMEVSTAEDSGEENPLDKEIYLVTYNVSGDNISDPQYEDVNSNLKSEQQDSATQQQVWSYFTALIPADQREVIREYSITTDGKGGSLAAVTQTMDDPNAWALEVDTADSHDAYSLTFTLVHEFGHLLTLGPSQVPPSLAVFNNPDDNNIYLSEVSKCPQYFPGEGCANANSYINAYYNQFWTSIHDEWNKINLEENEDLYYQKLDEFYYKYEDQFVTSYAATDPEEDMAETWAFFVLGEKPAGNTIAEQKILFFYQYPELVQLRGQILNNVCKSFPR